MSVADAYVYALHDRIEQLEAQLAKVTAERDEAMREALGLAVTLHRKHYSDVPQWEPLDTPAGVISQIDNMVAGISEAAEAADARFIEQRDSLVSVTKKLAKTEAKLAEVTAERDSSRVARDMHRAGEAGWTTRARAAEALLPVADRLGLEAAAYECAGTNRGNLPEDTALEIRALTPPADLVEQCKKGTDHE